MTPPRLVALVLAAVLLAACGDDAEQRRFATDEQPSFVAASPSAGATATAATPPTVMAVLSPESLFAGGSAMGSVFLARQDSIWLIDGSTGQERLIFEAVRGAPLVLAADAAGERVAILTGSAQSDDPSTLLVIGADGTALHRMDNVESSFGEAAEAARPVSLDWSHDGQRLLAGFRGGGLVDVPLQGEPRVVLGPERLPFLEEARWSPSSDLIAYVARSRLDGPGRLFVAKPRGAGTDPVALAPARAATGQSVDALAWARNGVDILYLQSSDTDEITGQDLFAIAPSGEERRLVASGSRVAPVGGIDRFAVSPDGDAVVYAVYVPGEDGPVFNSLWVQSLVNATRFQVPVEPGLVVRSLRWVESGLLWEAIPRDMEGTPTLSEPRLYRMGQDLRPRDFGRGAATPESASPIASPEPASPAV